MVKNVSFHVLQVGMRSRNQGGESPSNGHISCAKSSVVNSAADKGPSEESKKNKANRREDDVMASGTVKRHLRLSGETEKKTKKSLELSKEDLIQLLSIMEGELQVQSDHSGRLLLVLDRESRDLAVILWRIASVFLLYI